MLANLGHEGVGLITPAPEGDLSCVYLKAISVITEQPPSKLEDRPMTKKQWKINKNGRRIGTFMVYNVSHDTIVLLKNKNIQVKLSSTGVYKIQANVL